ncbi:hypothetical protein BS50DRAFT_658925 [Corynespora cassiicola Philippines]|uniref:Uncharacterized protein n=1 Tax=Corynespora cassiicola Philippines TaxID=1448308 RepID=A0A2T2N190_CORCC|nr:hypothetical protein BS50DRAFT_658925 [Corynespora cassiicola Philippines]
MSDSQLSSSGDSTTTVPYDSLYADMLVRYLQKKDTMDVEIHQVTIAMVYPSRLLSHRVTIKKKTWEKTLRSMIESDLEDGTPRTREGYPRAVNYQGQERNKQLATKKRPDNYILITVELLRTDIVVNSLESMLEKIRQLEDKLEALEEERTGKPGTLKEPAKRTHHTDEAKIYPELIYNKTWRCIFRTP